MSMRFIVPLSDRNATDPDRVGPKAANLATLSHAGLPTPGGFCITADAYRRQIEHLGLTDALREYPNADQPTQRRLAVEIRLKLLIYSIEPGTRLTASDLQSRLYLRLPTALLCRKLEAMLDGQQVDSIAFQPMFDQTRGAGATIRRLSDFLFAELEHSDTLLTNEIAIRSFEENLALCLLLGLPHNYTERLHRQKAAAAPGNVRRAEAFMQANASLPLGIAEIAEAAGCGVRALQIAFHRFRSTTPMRVLQQVRLEQARAEMLRPGKTQSLARISVEHGFSSPTRFAQLFRRKYGVYPSELLRERRDILAG